MSNEVMQAAFDKATAAVIAQGARSFDMTEGVCLYRGPNGTKCAIGHLISDEQMSLYAIQEDTNPHVFPSILLDQLLPEVDVDEAKTFCSMLQKAHDRATDYSFVSDFTKAANEVASFFSLTPIKQEG